MSITNTRNIIARIGKDIANMQIKIANEQKKVSDLNSKINQIKRSITKNTSLTSLKSKSSQVDRYSHQIASCYKKQADLQKKLASKTNELHKYENQLNKKITAEQMKNDKDKLDYQKKLTQELEAQKIAIENISTLSNTHPANLIEPISVKYDVFISHASEDKDEFVRPLAEHLASLGLKVWYDEFTLKWGDKLGRSIDKGLVNSRYGIVVLSKNFIRKEWTQYELEGLLAREINGTKSILPIWHEISKTELMTFSPTLANTLSLNSSINSIQEIAEKLQELLK